MPPLAVPRTILHVFPSFTFGGAQRRMAELANSVLAQHRHVIAALDGQFAAATLLARPVERQLMPFTCQPTRGLSLGNLTRFRRLIAQTTADLLITYNWGTLEAALAQRWWPLCRHVHFEDGFGPEEAGRQLRRRVWARRIALAGHSRVIVPSRKLERIARKIWRLAAERVHYIPNGVDCESLAKPAGNAGAGWRQTPDELLIGALGSLRPEKNFARLLRLVAQLPASPATRLVILGDGPERPALEAMAAELGIRPRTVFAGASAAAADQLAALDLFVLTSDTEQMPYCLLEAMAAGLPVVATDVGDVRAMLPVASRSYCRPPADEPGLLRACLELLRAPEQRRSIGAANQQHARRNFDRAAMLARYRTLFQSLLSG